MTAQNAFFLFIALLLGAGVLLILFSTTLKLINASVIINPLWWFGVIFLLLVGVRIYTGITMPAGSLAIWAGGVALALAYLSLHNTPLQNKSIMLAFGDRRIRGGPSRKGYTEGYNIPWIPAPIARFEDSPTLEFRVDFDNPSAYTKEDVPVKVDGFAIFQIDDAYRSVSVEDIRGSAQVMSVGVVRDTTDRFTIKELQQAHHRDQLSEGIYAGIQQSIADESSDVSSLLVKRAEVVEVDVPDVVKKTNTQKYVEPIEHALETVQAANRLAQVEAYTKKGVDPDVALAATLIDAGKSGATIVSGFAKFAESISAGLVKVGQGLTDLANKPKP